LPKGIIAVIILSTASMIKLANATLNSHLGLPLMKHGLLQISHYKQNVVCWFLSHSFLFR